MRVTQAILFAAFVALAANGPALAQETADSVAAGGLVVGGQGVELASHELFVSRDAIRSRYVFRNRGGSDVTLPVSFPLQDRSSLRHVRELRWPGEVRIMVDGRDPALQPERRALLRDVDHTELLTRLGVPLLYWDAAWEPAQRALLALPLEEQARLAGLGLVEIFAPVNGPRQLTPLWTIREHWQWLQVFPAGRDLVVEHSYAPGLAGSINVGMSSDAIRNSEYGQEQIRRFCLDDSYLAGMDRLGGGDAMHSVAETMLTFTFAGAPSPIGDFRLVVDRGEAGNAVGFCGEAVQAIGPTQVEMRRTNWQPQGEIQFIFLAPEG